MKSPETPPVSPKDKNTGYFSWIRSAFGYKMENSSANISTSPITSKEAPKIGSLEVGEATLGNESDCNRYIEFRRLGIEPPPDSIDGEIEEKNK
jgi:hypothetical protein